MKKIVFEVNHPGQVHLLRNAYKELKKKGHEITLFAKDEKVIKQLLAFYSIPFIVIGNKGEGIRGKFFKQLAFDFKLLKYVLKNKVSIGVGSSITNDHVSFFTALKAIHLSDDDDNEVPLLKKFSYPFSDVILAPKGVRFVSYPEKVISYDGTHELAYLHPSRFKADERVLKKAKISSDEVFFILRFVALKGHHDSGHKGIDYKQKKVLIDLLSQHGRVIITSEKEIEPEFEEFRLPVPPEEIHSLMSFATMFLGDSQTMISEAAVLGVPALKCNTFAGRLSIPNELEKKYGLCYSYQPTQFDKFYNHTKELLSTPDLKATWAVKREKFLQDKIDVTAFMVWFIENYPESKMIMIDNPEYQYRFK